MQLTSSVFKDQKEIPKRYTGEGQDVSLPLEWSGVPQKCREFVLICEDPDAPKRPEKDHPYVHWIIYNISPSVTSLPEGIPSFSRIEVPVRADQGINSFGKIGYGGPMPPVGHGTHHYIFRLYALDTELALKPGANKQELLEAMQGHIITQTELVGTYKRDAQTEIGAQAP